MNGIGSRFGSSCSYFMIASGLWPGALGGTRTPNLLIRSQMLYPLSYERSHCSILHTDRRGAYQSPAANPHRG
jgi:hypothetical protein